MSEKKGNNNKRQTKAGLMSKNSASQSNDKTENETNKQNRLDNLPKQSKHETEGNRESEGLH